MRPNKRDPQTRNLYKKAIDSVTMRDKVQQKVFSRETEHFFQIWGLPLMIPRCHPMAERPIDTIRAILYKQYRSRIPFDGHTGPHREGC